MIPEKATDVPDAPVAFLSWGRLRAPLPRWGMQILTKGGLVMRLSFVPVRAFAAALVIILSLFPFGAAEARVTHSLRLDAGTPSVWSGWESLSAGDLRVSIHNEGPGPVTFYVFIHCDHLQCPTLVNGQVNAGERVRIDVAHPAGKYMFKLDNDSQSASRAIGVFSQ